MFYLDLFEALEKAGVEYVLVGGVALNLHGVERATMDVDLAIALTEDNVARAVAAASTLGLVPVAPVDLAAVNLAQIEQWKTEKHMVAFGLVSRTARTPTVDLIVATPMPFAGLHERAVVKTIEGVRVPVASIEDLIAMKRAAGRSIDIHDIAALTQLQALKGPE